MTIDSELCEKLARRAAAGEATASRELAEHLWPTWIRMVHKDRSMGALARSEDHVHNVVARLVEKICKAEGRNLKLYLVWLERHPGKGFLDWVRIVTKNTVRDYVREQMGAERVPTGELSAKRLLNEFAASPAIQELGARPPITAAQTARELLEFAQQRLSPERIEALGRWLAGASFEDLAAAQGCSPQEAKRVVRAAVATLRRHFGPETPQS